MYADCWPSPVHESNAEKCRAYRQRKRAATPACRRPDRRPRHATRAMHTIAPTLQGARAHCGPALRRGLQFPEIPSLRHPLQAGILHTGRPTSSAMISPLIRRPGWPIPRSFSRALITMPHGFRTARLARLGQAPAAQPTTTPMWNWRGRTCQRRRIHHQLWRGMLRAGEANVGWRGKWHP